MGNFFFRENAVDGHNNTTVVHFIRNGELLNRPKHCPEIVFSQIIQSCWDMNPSRRPNFRDLHERLDGIIHQMTSVEYYENQREQRNNKMKNLLINQEYFFEKK